MSTACFYVRGIIVLTIVLLNENGWAGWHGLWHYYHFAAENIVAGLAALAISGVEGIPEHMIIPWENNWHDRYGMNEMVVKGIWGSEMDGVMGPTEWTRADADGRAWGFFERGE